MRMTLGRFGNESNIESPSRSSTAVATTDTKRSSTPSTAALGTSAASPASRNRPRPSSRTSNRPLNGAARVMSS